jgi:hypothetical protein
MDSEELRFKQVQEGFCKGSDGPGTIFTRKNFLTMVEA